jgi:hypothetical protein
MKRFHHKLSLRKATNVPTTRDQAKTNQCVNEFFSLVEDIYTKYDLKLKPHNVYNCGEIGLSQNHSICAKSQYNPCKIQGNGLKEPTNHSKLMYYNLKFSIFTGDSKKTSYRVYCCCNAAGDYLPPLVIYKSKHLYYQWVVGGPKDTQYNTSSNGCMEFFEWFKMAFVPKVSVHPGKANKSTMAVYSMQINLIL